MEQPEEDIRRLALNRLREIVLHDPEATALGSSLVQLGSGLVDDKTISQSFHDCFRNKASTTLQKRAGSLIKFFWWARSHGLRPLRFDESDLYGYLCHLRESGSGATALQHVIEALSFLDGAVRFKFVVMNQVLSGRCKGAARDSYLTKAPLSQKDPLSLAQVRALEELCVTAQSRDACIIGQLLFCVHSCCRWKDSQRIRSLTRESSQDVTLVHADAVKSKTTLTAEAQTRFLPYVALGTGVSFRDWSKAWLAAREAEELSFGSYALPSYSDREAGWTDAPMSSSEATEWLREFLQTAGAMPAELSRVGSHSCKSTMLTWAGRSVQVKFSQDERRLLGHHLIPGDRSMLTYSREAYTTLYGMVLAMYRLIESGEFDPDMTAVSRVLDCASAISQSAARETFRVQEEPQVSEADSDTSRASSAGVLSPEAGSSPGISSVCVPQKPNTVQSALWEPEDCVIHRLSGVVRIVRSGQLLKCGRLVTKNFERLPEEVPDSRELDHCVQCSKAQHP